MDIVKYLSGTEKWHKAIITLSLQQITREILLK